MHRSQRVGRHRRARRYPELVPVVGVPFPTEDEGVVGVVVLLVADNGLELAPVLGDVLHELVDALLELRISRRRGGVVRQVHVVVVRRR
jgi:hypothetical protein